MANELAVRLPGQLDLIAHVDIDKHQRRKTGVPVSYYAIRRAKGLLELLPQTMMPATVNEMADGAVFFTWERHDDEYDIVLQLGAQANGGVKYSYSIKRGKNEDRAGGFLKTDQPDPEVIGIVRRVVELLSPKDLRSQPNQQRLS
jgi:hypothetical protein